MMEPIVRSSRYAGKPVEEEEVRMPVVTEPRRDDRRAVQDRIKVNNLPCFFALS